MKLLSTQSIELIEAVARDNVWGIHRDTAAAKADWARGDTTGWGQNLLGRCLMKVRDLIVAEVSATSMEPLNLDQLN